MRVRLNSDYEMLVCTISLIITINTNMQVTSAPRRRSRGPAWRCHMAWSATSYPRRSRVKINPFMLIKNYF